MRSHLILIFGLLVFALNLTLCAQNSLFNYDLYPKVNDTRPRLSSPYTTSDGQEYVTAVTVENRFAIIPVTLSDSRMIAPQLQSDIHDFPYFAEHGLHSEQELRKTDHITGRSVAEITRLAKPGQLSSAGFLAEDEDIISVIMADNEIVRRLGSTHPQLAKPLFHVLNMMEFDLKIGRWNMARHRWHNIIGFYYNERYVQVTAEDTKGGQKSIFDDGIEGGFHIFISSEMTDEEYQFIEKSYQHISSIQRDTLRLLLSSFHTGEIQPQYIMRYGFYEGHTYWRTDPLAIAYIFGLMSLSEIEARFPGQLYDMLTTHWRPETVNKLK
jgi:hypothetical protein